MTIEDKIRKRVRTIEQLINEPVKRIEITKEEAKELKVNKIDGKELVIVNYLGEKTKKDCFAYSNFLGHEKCCCLKDLYCRYENCKFYRTDLNLNRIEDDIVAYTKTYNA